MNHRGINDRRKLQYIAGVNEFIGLAFGGKEDGTEVQRPCVNCNLCLFHDRSTIHNHLIVRGILINYNPWIHHGEFESHIDSSDDGIEEESSDRGDSFMVCDDMRPLMHEAANVEYFGIFKAMYDNTGHVGGKK